MNRPLLTRRGRFLLGLLVLVATAALFLRDRGSLEIEPRTSESALRSLPYLTWVPADDNHDKRGVTIHDRERAYPGLNLYSPRESHRAFLLDMDGEVLHQWDAAIDKNDTWQLVEPFGDGELLVIDANRRMLRIDRDSTVLWRLDRRVHHDVAVAASGEMFVLTREEKQIRRSGRVIPILDDIILRLSPQGEILERLSIFDLFGDRVPDRQWGLLERWLQSESAIEEMRESLQQNGFRIKNGSPPDLFHTNSIEVLPRGIAGISKAGALLISIREISLVAIVDLEERHVDWTWGPGIVRRQHHPSLLDNGNILIYDNLGGEASLSRVVEVDPTTREIVWQFNGDPPDSFFSALRGGCERLPNGNTLITESDRGRVFEITPDGDVVWEFYNPVMRSGGKERSSIYRLTRLEPRAVTWLERDQSRAGSGSAHIEPGS